MSRVSTRSSKRRSIEKASVKREEEEEKKESDRHKPTSSHRKKSRTGHVPAKLAFLNSPSPALISLLQALDSPSVCDPRIEMFYQPNTTLQQFSYLWAASQYFSSRSQGAANPTDAAVDAALLTTPNWIMTQAFIAAGAAAPPAGLLGTNATPIQVVFEAGPHVVNWIRYLHTNSVVVFQLPAGAAAAAAHVPVERLQFRYVMGNHTSGFAPLLI